MKTERFRYRTRNRVFNQINPKDIGHGLNKYILFVADRALQKYGYPHAVTLLAMITGGIINEANPISFKELRSNMGRNESKRD